MTILWLKAFHIFFMISWMAGIFYLPRLFVYHAEAKNKAVSEQFKIMERRLWWFVLPFAVLTGILGIAILFQYGLDWLRVSHWMHLKLTLVLFIYIYYGYLFHLMKQFAADKNTHSSKFYRFLNESPVFVVIAIVVCAVVKPSFT